jgi:hypothetical protein
VKTSWDGFFLQVLSNATFKNELWTKRDGGRICEWTKTTIKLGAQAPLLKKDSITKD